MNPSTHSPVKSKPNDLPGPRGIPLLGSALSLKPSKIHLVLEKWAEQYGPFYQFKIGRRVVYGISDPDSVAKFWRERPDTFTRITSIQDVFFEMGIEGVFPAEGEVWQRQRRIWLKAMNAHRVLPFFGRMQVITERLMQRWTQAAKQGKSVDVVEDLMRFTVDVTTLFAYGYEANTLQQGEDVVQKQLMHVFPAVNRRINSPFPYWRYVPLPADYKLKKALKNLEAYVMPRIEEARQQLRDNPKLRSEPENLLQGLIVAGEDDSIGLTDQEVYGNTVGVLLAGEDTTAYTMAWMIYELIQHPAAFQNLRAELDQVLQSSPLWAELEQGAQMPYLDAVTNETQRLRPVATITGLTAKQDVELGGMQFPAGSHFFVPLRANSFDETRYPQARSFLPERWIETKQGHPAQQAPQPFGGGKRTCPGMNLALQEIKSVIAMLVKNFDLELLKDGPAVTERSAFTMYPANLKIRLHQRQSCAVPNASTAN